MTPEKTVVVVESPAKARTIGGYLGADYVVESSIGHIRDLPNNAADTPAKIKDKPWGRLAVDVDNGFHALYVISESRKQQVAKLKRQLVQAGYLQPSAVGWYFGARLFLALLFAGLSSITSGLDRGDDAPCVR